MKRALAAAVLAVGLSGIARGTTEDKPMGLTPVPFNAVKVTSGFWEPRIRLDRERVIPHNFKYCEDTGRLSNFDKAAGKDPGKFEGIYFNDSDVYKVIEAAAYALAQQRDPELERTTDAVIDRIAAAQLPDGYLYTFYTVNKQLDKRWSNEKDMHETYCAGHLIEAAVAYHQATGKRKLLDVAIKLADHIDTVFGPGRKRDVPGHQEIELALVKLYRATGNERYVKLAQFFIDQRGNTEGRATGKDYDQDHVPVRDQREIVGHAVRAMYLYCGVADLAALTRDAGYLATMDAIWHDVVDRKMYVTGGIGPSAHNEGFTVPYDLPNDTAYAETCAAIGMALWNGRLTLLHADAKYADVVEREMYNGLLSGISLDGEKFFYVNPLGSRGRHHRQPWFGCACCPPNVARFLPTVGGYAYATDGDNVYVSHYLSGEANFDLAGKPVTITQDTNYPWDGTIKLTPGPGAYTLHLRIPGWCDGATAKVNGAPVDLNPAKGYAPIAGTWKAGDVVELSLPMPVKRVYADPRVQANVGRVALQRGPVVYCLEGADNDKHVRNIAVPKDATLSHEWRPNLLNGVVTLKGQGLAKQSSEDAAKPITFTAVPYYAWDNRAPGEMVVWLPEDPALAEVPGGRYGLASASHVGPTDSVDAINDGNEPNSSNDHSLPRLTWWDHKGTPEWAQYDFPEPRKITGVEVYWFDDTGTGQCRLPASWTVSYWTGGEWRRVKADIPPAKPDEFNKVSFDPVIAEKLRIDVQLQDGYSGGILEWRVLSPRK